MAGGYRSHEARWIGGASQTPVFVPGGYRSFEAFWLGGASASAAIIPPVIPTIVNAGAGILRKRRIYDDDEEVLAIISQHLARLSRKKDD